MQLKFQRIIAKPSKGFWWQKYSPCLWYLSNLFLAISYITLLFYALVWEAGNIVNLPMKRIGFYNFCLWDQEAEKLNCLMPKELEKMGINMVALVLSRICVYITPVLCLFAATTVLQALCFKDRAGFKLACVLLAICSLILPVGLVLFTFHIWRWIHIFEIGEVFAMLVGAHILLLLHVILIVLYLARFNSKTLTLEDNYFLQGASRKHVKCLLGLPHVGMEGKDKWVQKSHSLPKV